MAEGGHSSPIVSPSMNGLTSDKIMEIADDVDVFTQFYDQLQKESRGITSSTPIRSTISNTGMNWYVIQKGSWHRIIIWRPTMRKILLV